MKRVTFETVTIKYFKDSGQRRFQAPQGQMLKDVYFHSNVPDKVSILDVPLSAWPNRDNNTEAVDSTEYVWTWDSSAIDTDYLIIVYRVYCNE